jgi:hypothetical protein
MTTYTIKPITETSWILNKSGEKLAIVSQTPNEIIIIGNIIKKKHKSLDDFIKYLNNDVTFEEAAAPETEKEAAEINGYPIKHEVWYDVLNEGIPSYTRTKNSAIRYAAGYYALKFTNGYSPSFCPKQSTLSEYEYLGPFKSKLEMQNSISQKNNSSNV